MWVHSLETKAEVATPLILYLDKSDGNFLIDPHWSVSEDYRLVEAFKPGNIYYLLACYDALIQVRHPLFTHFQMLHTLVYTWWQLCSPQ